MFANALPPIPPLLVGPKEAARLLDVSPRKLWTMTQQGRIAHLKFGRLVKYAIDDIRDFIARSKIKIGGAV